MPELQRSRHRRHVATRARQHRRVPVRAGRYSTTRMWMASAPLRPSAATRSRPGRRPGVATAFTASTATDGLRTPVTAAWLNGCPDTLTYTSKGLVMLGGGE